MDQEPSVNPVTPTSVFHSALPLESKLERARLELLDLSARNRLLNMPRSARTVRTIEVVDERSSEVYRLLIKEGRTFSFVPGRASTTDDVQNSDAEEIKELALPDDDKVDARGVLSRHADTKLQTRLTAAGLQKRLLDLYADARTLEEEQGVNILYLTLGSLKWIDPSNANNVRFAPLILLPVSLERGSAAERFKLKWRQEEPSANLSLEAYLDRFHGLKLPAFEASDDFDPNTYMADVAATVSSKEGWTVAGDDIVLGFFSFAKFLMYRDLDPEVWPTDGRLTELPLIRSLLAEGFPHREAMIPEDAQIDPLIPPSEMRHIMDSDSSQTLAIHDARGGHSLVIQGPPGTGKSQTIANVIAAAIADGKTVLFVAEKMAALDVVKRRLDQAGVGDACLELHSNKANKKLLVDELRRTWELGSPRGNFPDALNSQLKDVRDSLNNHAERLHRTHSPSALSPYQVMGELVRLRDQGQLPTDIDLESPATWSPEELYARQNLLGELVQRLREIGRPADHPWWCVGLDVILPTQADRLARRISDLKSQLEEFLAQQRELALELDLPPIQSLREFDGLATFARRIAAAPELGASLAAKEWEDRPLEIETLLNAGYEHQHLNASLAGKIHSLAWSIDVQGAHDILARLPIGFGADAFHRANRLSILLPQLTESAEQLRGLLGLTGDIRTVSAVERTLEIGRHVAAAPNASPEAFSAAVWDHGVEQAGDLVEAVATLQDARIRIGNRLTDAAWSADCVDARQSLASCGNSIFRFLNGGWRRGNRLVRSFLNPPEMPLAEVIPLLDILLKGQQSLAALRSGDELGRSAFGLQWRGERSDASTLRALLEWMRGLGPLAKEIRSVASQAKNQSEIGVSATCLQTIWDECDLLLDAIQRDLGQTDANDLPEILDRCTAIAQADARCKEVFIEVPLVLTERLSLLQRFIGHQKASNEIAASGGLGKACFGDAWKGALSPWPSLRSAAEWISGNRDIRALASRVVVPHQLGQRADVAEALLSNILQATENIFIDLRIDRSKLFGVDDLYGLGADSLALRLQGWLSNPEQLSKWVAYNERANHARGSGLRHLIDRLEDGRLSPDKAVSAFRHAYYEALLEDQVRQVPELGRFDGQMHGRLAREFADLDRQRIIAARLEVVRAHHRRIPPTAGGGIGPLGVLRAEIAKRRGHMPIRQLMVKAAPAIQALKPVAMMSPLSVAQFLPPGLLTFDLLVMDEASQIQPVDALGAIARCRQVVVVGDERQLPPTKFFAKMTGGQPEEDDSETAQVADIESILGLFIARGLPQRMLRWHYRSRHQSLIAVSNTQFYENKLFIVPSPYTQEAGRGLRFHHVPDGRFDSGNSRTNAVEAKVVAEAVIRHAKEHPNLSLGVASFSANQRRAIRDQIELLRRVNPDTEAFFHAHPGEPFFVKNLENVQGDERDVIFISVGYGRNPTGYMAMVFGPLSSEGGERRLNVLISRAKLRCEVYSSITDEDIDTERGKGRGVFAFKVFLHFARTGRLSMAKISGRDHDSVFEIQVANALQERGYPVHAQVGIAGFFIDLAIADPERPGRYVLGIECDGASYHSARSARDRDRLRQSVLEDHGWIIHRIWSTDWFQRPKEQIESVIAAIEAAKAELDSRGEYRPSADIVISGEEAEIDRSDSVEINVGELETTVATNTLYVQASPQRPQEWPELHETPSAVLAKMVQEIVTVEGPVHVDEVVARVRSAWDLQRSGVRIQTIVERAISLAIDIHKLQRHEDFLSTGEPIADVRDRSEVISTNLRRPEMLPPQELRAGVLQIVRTNLGASQDEVVQAVLRRLGFRATSGPLRELVQSAVAELIQNRLLKQQGGYLAVEVDSTLQTAK